MWRRESKPGCWGTKLRTTHICMAINKKEENSKGWQEGGEIVPSLQKII
jgi:hypothetical protein